MIVQERFISRNDLLASRASHAITFNMTNRYTHDEWLAIIKQAERELPSEPVEYKAVSIASKEFAKIIDHTLLKEDATKTQIDMLCEEARRHNFKACSWSSDQFG